MARIAIIIGVSAYARQQNLPACANDAELVRVVLNSSNEYEDILFLAGNNTNSDEVKHQLTQFVEKHKARDDLDEVFFFYSGHGQFVDDEFYYIFSDFDDSRRNRTSLKNSELDGYLRTLCPNLAVKIVDACNAGVQYVKDVGGLSEIIEKGSIEKGLKKVYFLFSSLFDQSSFADSAVSHYTRSFIEAIFTNGRPEIRYRDIVDQISDQFLSNKDQKPFFVIQADNTEIFGSFQDKEKSEIRFRLEAITSVAPTSTVVAMPAKQPTLADLLKEQAKDYLKDNEIVETIERIPVEAKQFTPPSDIADLFEVKITTHRDFTGLAGLKGIGTWLNENKMEYFARVVTRVEEYEDYGNSLARFMAATGDNIKMVKKSRTVISGYEPMWEKPAFWRIELALSSSLPNIPMFKLNILYLFSKLDISLFYSIDEKWAGPGNVGEHTEYGEWKALQLRLRALQANANLVNPVFEDFTNSVTEKLKKIAGVPNEPLAEKIDESTKSQMDE
jgi:hypothetical protein